MSNSAEILDWDSNFFGIKIASINIKEYNEEFILENLNFYKSKDFDLVYLFTSADSHLSSSISDIYNCKLVDTKVVYSLDISNETTVAEPINIEVFNGNPAELYDLGIQAGTESRYKIDSNFSEDSFKQLYTTWIDNSCNYKFADKVLVYKKSDINAGFISLKKNLDILSIGLIATDKAYRGTGIGQNLISYAKKYAKENNCKRINVATQKQNKGACLFYEKNGMSVKSESNVYHIWLKQ